MMNQRNMIENSARMMMAQRSTNVGGGNNNFQQQSLGFNNESEYVSQQNNVANHPIYAERERKQQQIYGSNQQQQQIQVQILPQDDDHWGDNTTAMVGDFSDFNDDMTEDGRSSYFNPRQNNNQNGETHRYMNNKYKVNNNSNNNNINQNSQNKSEFLSDFNSSNHTNQPDIISGFRFYINAYFSYVCTLLIVLGSFISPILFIILPRLNLNQQWLVSECGLECEAILIGIAFKLFLLFLATAILFGGQKNDRLPRFYELRLVLLFLLLIITFSFWLFYGVRIIENKLQDYHKILQFAATYVDVLLVIFIITVFVVELRHMRPQYAVKIVRSPDGHQFEYLCGKMSIQRASLWLLENYYKDFVVYNPWLENAHRKPRGGGQLLQLEQEQSDENNKSTSKSKKRMLPRSGNVSTMIDDEDNRDNVSMASKKNNKSLRTGLSTTSNNLVGGNFSANDRFYEEYEYERRLRKRRARLLTSTEEAFTHIKRVHQPNGSMISGSNNNNINTIMDPYEAAQAIFTSIARDLRRYLRVTRQQPFYNRETIIQHLADCISYDMSPKSFLQRYLTAEPLIFNQKSLLATANHLPPSSNPKKTNNNNSLNIMKTLDQSWILISDTVLYQNIEDNLMIVLKQNDVSLMCTFKKLPRFNIIEDIIDPKRNKFMLKLNSETTV